MYISMVHYPDNNNAHYSFNGNKRAAHLYTTTN